MLQRNADVINKDGSFNVGAIIHKAYAEAVKMLPDENAKVSLFIGQLDVKLIMSPWLLRTAVTSDTVKIMKTLRHFVAWAYNFLQNGIQNFVIWLIQYWEIALQSQILDIVYYFVENCNLLLTRKTPWDLGR